MNAGRYVMAAVILWVFLFVIEYFFHGVLLRDVYAQVQNLLRPEGGQAASFVWMLIAYLIMAFGVTFIFAKGYENRGIGEGIRFGLIIGVTFGVTSSLILHQVFALSAGFTIWTMVGGLIEMVLAGILLALIYTPKAGSTD